MTSHQRHIIAYLRTVQQATVAQIYDNVPFSYYHNATKHLGTVLSNMVACGYLVRIKKGTYAINTTKPLGKQNIVKSQNEKLF